MLVELIIQFFRHVLYFNAFEESIFDNSVQNSTLITGSLSNKPIIEDGNIECCYNPTSFRQSKSEMNMKVLITSPSLRHQISPRDRRIERSTSYTCEDIPLSLTVDIDEAKLDAESGGSGIPAVGDSGIYGHHFCAIPLEIETFCDVCSNPIYGLGWGPVCQKCADCHMTCHWFCKDRVNVYCYAHPKDAVDESSPDATAEEEVTSQLNSLHLEEATSDQSIEDSVVDDSSIFNAELLSACPNGDVCDSLFEDSDAVVQSNDLSGQMDQFSFNVDSDVNVSQTVETDERLLQQNLPPVIIEPEVQSGVVLENESNHHTASYSSTATSAFVNHNLPAACLFKSPIGAVRRNLRSESHRNVRQKAITSVKLKARHSFLAGQGPGSTLSSRLSYDFSSFDKKAIAMNGIKVRQIESIQTVISDPDSAVSLSFSTKTEEQSLQSTSETDSSSSGVALASIMQTTAEFLRTRPRRMERQVFKPVPSIPFTSVVIGPRNTLPWSVEHLADRLTVFNLNEFGLQARTADHLLEGDCEGQVRVHINLLRPVRMLLSSRPTSIFDIVGKDSNRVEDSDPFDDLPSAPSDDESDCLEHNDNGSSLPRSAVTANVTASPGDYQNILGVRNDVRRSKFSTFWLPRGSTKVLHVRLSTTSREVVSTLLHRFKIEDNSQKFALYEHTIEGDQEVSVRKLFDDESPLGLILQWTGQDASHFNQLLSVKRLVLQENETGDIDWIGFSVPELRTFLAILNQEEAEYSQRIQLKFEIQMGEIRRMLAIHEKHMQLEQTLDQSECRDTVDESVTLSNDYHDGDAQTAQFGVGDQINHLPGTMQVGIPLSNSNHRESASNVCQPDLDKELSDSDAAENCARNEILSENVEQIESHHSSVRLLGSMTLPHFNKADDKIQLGVHNSPPLKKVKKVERMNQRRLMQLEKNQIKEEKKRRKGEAKLSKPPKAQTRKWSLFTGLSSVLSQRVASSSKADPE